MERKRWAYYHRRDSDSVYLIEGDGFLVIEPQNARVDIRSTRVELPALVMTAREKVREAPGSFESQ
jgi:hypothetical protein